MPESTNTNTVEQAASTVIDKVETPQPEKAVENSVETEEKEKVESSVEQPSEEQKSEQKSAEKPQEKKEEQQPKSIKIEDEEVPVEKLVEAYEKAQEAQEVLDKHEEWKQGIRTALIDNPGQLLFEVYTSNHKGNKQQAYEDVLTFAKNVIQQHIDWEAMDDKDRALKIKEQEMAQKEQELNKYKSVEQQQQQAAEQVELAKTLIPEMKAGLTEAGLPTDNDHMSTLAAAMLEVDAAGLKLSAVEVAKEVKKQLDERKKAILKNINPEELDEDTLKRISEHNINKAKKQKASSAKTVAIKPPESEPAKSYVNFSDLDDALAQARKR